MRVVIQPYRRGSQGMGLLRTKLREEGITVKQVAPTNRYTSHAHDVVLNWGSSNQRLRRRVPARKYINSAEMVSMMVDKGMFYSLFRSTGSVPIATTNLEVAREWGEFYARDTLTGRGGDGCHYISDGDVSGIDPVLYTKPVPNRREWRIHLGSSEEGVNEVVSWQAKLIRNHTERIPQVVNVRSHSNNWVFGRGGFDGPPDSVLDVAHYLGHEIRRLWPAYDFLVAMDVAWHPEHGATVLEVNTAPGIEGSTVNHYSDYILRKYGEV